MSMAETEIPAHIKKRCAIAENGCWLWHGSRSPSGYGWIRFRGKNYSVHRLMFMTTYGVTLTRSQVVCHRCDVRNCCNPEHLFSGTQRDNLADMYAKGRSAQQRKTSCPKGHPYSVHGRHWDKRFPHRRTCGLCDAIRDRIENGWAVERANTEPLRRSRARGAF